MALRPFTLRRRILLHAVECPLWYDGERFGLAPSWCACLRILEEEDAAALALAVDGPAAFVAYSLEWAERHEPAIAFKDIAAAADAIKDEWFRLCELDAPERKPGEVVTAAGEADGPGTDWRRNSSATASTPGAGTGSAPSTAPSASSSWPGAPSTAPSTAAGDSAG